MKIIGFIIIFAQLYVVVGMVYYTVMEFMNSVIYLPFIDMMKTAAFRCFAWPWDLSMQIEARRKR
jgi:hypothetical protein